jgi:hypothetical protein
LTKHGTALAISHHGQFAKLQKAIFIDASPRVVDILNQRIKALGASHQAEAVRGDYGDAPGISRIFNDLPDSCLNLVFIDPTECDVPFQTIQKIVAHLQNAGLLINVALGTTVIVSRESGPGSRPMLADWVTDIRDQCRSAGVAFHFKQWGGVFKKRNGRLLEGRTWGEMPPIPAELLASRPVRGRLQLLLALHPSRRSRRFQLSTLSIPWPVKFVPTSPGSFSALSSAH